MGFMARARQALAHAFDQGIFNAVGSMDPANRQGWRGPIESGATQGRRGHGIRSSGAGPSAAVIMSGELLRQRSRAMMRDNPWARNARDTFVANAVGTGVVPRWLFDNPDWRKSTQRTWTDWTDEADATGTRDLYGLQAQIVGCVFEAGECFVRRRSRLPEDGLTVPLQLQVIEPEQVPLWYSQILPNGNRILAGIEFDVIGRRVAYWMLREHPGDLMLGVGSAFGNASPVRVPADQVDHIFQPIRPGQVRGRPWLANVLLRLYDLDEYEDAELLRKKGAAMFGGTIEAADPDKIDEIFGQKFKDAAERGGLEIAVEPNTWPVLPPGFHMNPSAPADVGPNFDLFHRSVLLAIAAGTGITPEMLTGDLSRVNYSSIRAGLLEFRRRCEAFIHQTLVFQHCRPLLTAWLDAAVTSGAVKAPGYLKRSREYQRVSWVPQGWKWVDPLKEVTAYLDAIAGGLTSRARIIAEQGEDAEVIDQENHDDQVREAALNLIYVKGAARTTVRDTGTVNQGEGATTTETTPGLAGTNGG